MLKDNLAKKLAEHKDRITKGALASKAGISSVYFSQILNGTVTPGVYTIAKMAKVFGCTIDELIGRKAPLSNAFENYAIEKACKFKHKLAISTVLTTADLLKKSKRDVNFEEFLEISTLVYQYSLGKNSTIVDEYFANWLIQHFVTSADSAR